MNNPFLYFTGLLVVMTAASLMAATAQENSSAVLNNTSQKDSDLNNESLNISVTNNTILNATNSTRGNSTNNFTFMIGGDAKVMQTNSSRIHVLGKDPENQASERSSFMIKGYVHPIRNATYEGQYSLNAAGLSRGVEGTAHGYVTYHN